MISRALTFGAPVTDPGGNAAASSCPSPAPAGNLPRTSETKCHTPGWASARSSAGTRTLGQADPAEIVAHQVDDHHVLRPVLGGALQRLTLPPREEFICRPGPGALDRPRQHARPGAAQEQLR